MSSPEGLRSRNEDAAELVLCQDEKKDLYNHNLHNRQDCIEEERIDMERELKASKQATVRQLEEMKKLEDCIEEEKIDMERELKASKQTTVRQLEEMKKLEATAQETVLELEKEFCARKEATECLLEEMRQLKERAEKDILVLRDELEGSKQTIACLDDLRATSTDNRKHVKNTKRPLLKRFKGMFRRSTKKKKKKDFPEPAGLEMVNPALTPKANRFEKGEEGPSVVQLHRNTAFRNPDYEIGANEEYENIDGSLTAHRGHSMLNLNLNGDSKSEDISTDRRRSLTRESSLKSQTSIALAHRPYWMNLCNLSGDSTSEEISTDRKRSVTRESSLKSQISIGIALPELPSRRNASKRSSACSLQLSAQFFPDEDFEVSNEEHEPITIVKHPKSQSAKEGSKVELKCKVEGKRTDLLYQWFKDRVAVIGQNSAILVLDAVELKDFGRYTCYVSYADTFDEGVKSSPAILDVLPQNRNGMRLKLLAELDINTRDEVAVLLESKRSILRGYRHVAAKFGMKKQQIVALDSYKEPGKDVMAFLEGSQPDLTVYSFCKALKEDKIGRFDIVKILENHFLISEGSLV